MSRILAIYPVMTPGYDTIVLGILLLLEGGHFVVDSTICSEFSCYVNVAVFVQHVFCYKLTG